MKNNELSLATIINETTNKSHGLTPLKNSLTLQLNTIQLSSPFQAKQTKEEKFKEAIMQEVTSAKTINVSSLKKGVYIITNDKGESFKFIKD